MTNTASLTDVEGILVGHAEDLVGCTGCTVVLCPPEGAAAAAVVRGPASSTRQFGIANPLHLVDRVNGVLLAGGSAFGLDSAGGVMRFLEDQDRGFRTLHGRVPVVPTAILFDRGLGEQTARPTAEMAYEAAASASSDPVAEGNTGAGTGATVGKLFSARCATKGGVGSWSMSTGDGLVVGVLVALNAFGDVLDPAQRQLIAGARRGPQELVLVDTAAQILAGRMRTSFAPENTTLAVVATNAKLEGAWLNRVARWASDGLSECLRPAFSAVDGDVVIALATEEMTAEPHRIGLMARESLIQGVLRAVRETGPLGGLPSAAQLPPHPL